MRTNLNAIIHLAYTYISALLYRYGPSLLINPKGTQRFIHQVLNAIDLESDDPVLGSLTIENLMGGGISKDIHLLGKYYRTGYGGTHLLLELASLAYLVKVTQPRLIFEIGTFAGRTTRLMAVNTGPDCRVFTLDLPQPLCWHRVGVDYCHTAEAAKIKQLFGDGRAFDFSPWYGKCDFVWVDACHDYEYVLSDTRNALKLVRPGGQIGWHDYRHSAWWSGVTRVVRMLKKKYPQVRYIRGTTITMMQI